MIPIATKNGAISQGRETGGVLREGFDADMILIDLRSAHNIPVRTLSSSLLFSADSSDVYMTMCDGRILYENGEYKTIDEEKIKFDFMRVMADYFPNDFSN
jgi:5-methylthioadenosine/S-adenosylhomocysteine deaminase